MKVKCIYFSTSGSMISSSSSAFFFIVYACVRKYERIYVILFAKISDRLVSRGWSRTMLQENNAYACAKKINTKEQSIKIK